MVLTIKEGAAPPWGLPWPLAPTGATTTGAQRTGPAPPHHRGALSPTTATGPDLPAGPPARRPAPVPLFPAPRENPGTGLLPPPVLYACPGPYAIFSAFTVLSPGKIPAAPPGDGTQGEKFQKDFWQGDKPEGAGSQNTPKKA